MTAALLRLLRSRLWKPSAEEEVSAELAFHLEMRTREYVAMGMSPAEAREQALRRFGDMARVERTCRATARRRDREMRRAEWFGELRQDATFAIRQLAKSPVFTAVAVVTLALGIGANTAIFSIVNGVLLRPLPYADPGRLVRVWPAVGPEQNAFSVLNFLDWREQATRSFSGMAAATGQTLNLTGEGEPERLRGAQVTANMFDVLGTRAVVGRTFVAGDDAAGAGRVAVLSTELWRRRFGGDSRVVGRTLRLNGEPFTVVGVAATGTGYPRTAELWVPFRFDSVTTDPTNRGAQYLSAVARLRRDVTAEAAKQETDAIAQRLAEQYPASNKQMTSSIIQPLHEQMVGDVRKALVAILGAVGLVLLIACANVANLMLVRATARETEVAVRAALGAGRGRIIRQFLTESLILSLAGATAGVVLASWLLRLVARFGPEDIPRLADVALDGRALGVTALVAVATGVVFGLIPALQSAAPDLARTLREGGRGVRSRAASARMRASLVVGELALAVMLLAGAGLMIRSFRQLLRVELGFEPERVVAFQTVLPDAKYDTVPKIRALTSAYQERLRTIPGASATAIALSVPMSGMGFFITIRHIDGFPDPAPGEGEASAIRSVGPGFFRALGIPLVRGRDFTDQDHGGAAKVAIVNRAAVRKFFKGQDPIGRRIEIGWGIGDGDRVGGEVVGIVGDVREDGVAEEAAPILYFPFDQAPPGGFTTVIKTAGATAPVLAAARAALRDLDPELPIYNVRTMEERVAESVAQPRFYTVLLGGFAAVALLLAAVGIYGVMSYSVGQRTGEIGVRMALGARPGDVQRLVVRQGMTLAIVGVAIGVAAALASGRVMASMLFGVKASDPVTFAAVLAVLSGAALLACWLPARRAARVDPMTALRAS
ncbi:MAG TPA: ABC transporter permease [Gemmatimonadaceae bacterium]|nr:ABC transporter permease [Gemmatimonadaceae bacterium]